MSKDEDCEGSERLCLLFCSLKPELDPKSPHSMPKAQNTILTQSAQLLPPVYSSQLLYNYEKSSVLEEEKEKKIQHKTMDQALLCPGR